MEPLEPPKRDRLSAWIDMPLVAVGSVGLLLMMAATVVSAFGAAVFSRPIPDIVTIDEVLMAFVVFLPLAFVQLRHDHIEVGIATDWLPERTLEKVRIFGLVMAIAVFALLFWGLAIGAYGAWDENDLYTGEYSVPSWPMRAVAAIGVAGFLLRLVKDLFQTVRKLRQHR
ncbi:MAG TPA: TRAP transporter small permease [Usitatibacter sp.]|nr:TRAP transporter small permease [Usitatibacter sp.]